MSFVKWCKKKYIRLYVKMVREKATPEFIARGWAIGMFYGCLIPFGFQLICSIPTAILLRGSKIGATVGTFITNHFTIFVIYPCQCYVGSLFMGKAQSFSHLSEAFVEVIEKQSYQSLLDLGWDLCIAFFIGGVLFALLMTPITYLGVLGSVRKHRARAKVKAAQRRAKLLAH